MFDTNFYDPTWRSPELKQEFEDEFTMPFGRELGKALDAFAKDGRRVANDFSPSLIKPENQDGYAPIGESASAVYAVTDEIYNLFDRMRHWFVTFANNGRETITGSEYWALVDILEQIRQCLIPDSQFTQDNLAKYGPHYQNNIDALNKKFREIDFANAKGKFMQPLYAEILKQRQPHQMNIFIELKSTP